MFDVVVKRVVEVASEQEYLGRPLGIDGEEWSVGFMYDDQVQGKSLYGTV